MKRFTVMFAIALCFNAISNATCKFSIEGMIPRMTIDNKAVVEFPKEGLWSVATQWKDDWMAGWVHANPTKIEQNDQWTIVSGQMTIGNGTMIVRDSYRQEHEGLVKCVRRYEWHGNETLRNVTLSVRLQVNGSGLMPCLPGILYYGNKNGAKVNPDIIPVYNGKDGEFAVFEEHRYPMPFAMLENSNGGYAVALHAVPSPVRGAVLSDQWWSLGVEAGQNNSELVMYTGPVGYNNRHSVAKALQASPMKYGDTYINMEPGRIVEKVFYIEYYPVSVEGTGFQQPIYTSLDLYKPYDADRFPTFDEIVNAKYSYAKKRWIDMGNNAVGFDMYDKKVARDIVMGWCGQADSPGYALQILEKNLNDNTIHEKVQTSLDFLSTYPFNENSGLFCVGYNGNYHGGDPVSCGQAMYNIAKAVAAARKSKKYNTAKWEAFLKKACDGVSRIILSNEWNPVSTADAFYIAPLAIASRLFKNTTYKEAAVKAGKLYADRHLKMNGCYWGGTLDATCEDKEGAWAAFQGFLELYEQYKESKYLSWAKHAMDVCISYVVVWDIPLPPGRLADFNFKTTGWTVVSAQNQHVDVYGVLFAPEVYKMGTYLKDERLHKLSKVMYRSCFQLTDAFGSQGEQVQHTNFAQNGDMSNVYKLRGGYSENWTVFWITAHFLNAAARFKEMGVTP